MCNSEIKRQIGNLLGNNVIGSHLDRTVVLIDFASKIEMEFDELADLCLYKLLVF